MDFKKLVSPVQEERNAEFLLFQGYFRQNTDISREEYLKVFKALYYHYWLCDKRQVQAELCLKISNLFAISLEKNKFIAYFLETMDREWDSIDSLRLDKFYLLLRSFFKEISAHSQVYKGLKDTLLGILHSEKSKRGLKLFLIQVVTEEILVKKKSKILLQIYFSCLKDHSVKDRICENLEKIIKSPRVSIKLKNYILQEISFQVSKEFLKKLQKLTEIFDMQNKLIKFKQRVKIRKRKTVKWSQELEKVKIFSKKDCVSPQ